MRAQKVRRLVSEYMAGVLAGCDLLINPAQVGVAPKLGSEGPRNFVDNILTVSNLYGSPSIVLRLGEEDELPFSVALEVPIYQDGRLLSYALWLEGVIDEL